MPKARQRFRTVRSANAVPAPAEVGSVQVVPIHRTAGPGGTAALEAETQMMDDPPMFTEVAGTFPDLFTDDEKWNALVADPDEPFVEVPDPTFHELIEKLTTELPETTVAAVQAEVWTATELNRPEDKEVGGDTTDDGSVHDAAGAADAGAEVVDGDGGGDPPVQEAREGAGG